MSTASSACNHFERRDSAAARERRRAGGEPLCVGVRQRPRAAGAGAAEQGDVENRNVVGVKDLEIDGGDALC